MVIQMNKVVGKDDEVEYTKEKIALLELEMEKLTPNENVVLEDDFENVQLVEEYKKVNQLERMQSLHGLEKKDVHGDEGDAEKQDIMEEGELLLNDGEHLTLCMRCGFVPVRAFRMNEKVVNEVAVAVASL